MISKINGTNELLTFYYRLLIPDRLSVIEGHLLTRVARAALNSVRRCLTLLRVRMGRNTLALII